MRYGYWAVYIFLAFFFVCAMVNHLSSYNMLNRYVSPVSQSRVACLSRR